MQNRSKQAKLTAEPNTAVSCEDLLIKSIQIYDEIYHIYVAIPEILTRCTPEDVQGKLSGLDSLFEKVRSVDRLLANAFETEATLVDIFTVLLEKRQESIKTAIAAKNHTLQKVQNVNAVVQNELTNLSTSHNALTSYKRVNTTNRKLIQRAF